MINYKKHKVIKCIEKIILKYDFEYMFVGTMTVDEVVIDEILYENKQIFINSGGKKINIININSNLINALDSYYCLHFSVDLILNNCSFNIKDFSNVLKVEKDNVSHIPVDDIYDWFDNLNSDNSNQEYFVSDEFQNLLITNNFILVYTDWVNYELLTDRLKKAEKRIKFNL
jgi:hypothetical protein